MPSLRRAANLAAASLVALALILVPISSASTNGGASAGGLGSATGGTQRITGVELSWTPVPTVSGWKVGGLTITADPGQRFAAGDTVKVTLDPKAAGPCEVVSSVTAASAVHSVDGTAIAKACGVVAMADLGSVALAISGKDQTRLEAGNLGGIAGTLASFAAGVIDPERSLQTSASTVVVAGIRYLDEITVNVTGRALSAADLAGASVLVRLHDSDSSDTEHYGAAISLNPSAPIHATTGGDGSLKVTIDAAAVAQSAGDSRPRVADTDQFDILLYTPQHLGAARDGTAGAYSLSLVSGTIDAGSSGVAWAVDAVELDSRLRYKYAESETNDSGGSLAFCHSFTVTNSSSSSVAWTVTFDTSLAPLWGFDPTQSGAFRSTKGWRTISYEPETHLWTIGGPLTSRTLQRGASTTGSYCVDKVPVPAVSPDRFTTTFTRTSYSSALFVSFDLDVTSQSRWNVPWELTVDLADHVCAAGLTGRTVLWSSSVQVVSSKGTVYTLRGVTGRNTRYVSGSRPVDVSGVASFIPAGGQSGATCRDSRSIPQADTDNVSVEPSPSASVEPSQAAPAAPVTAAVPTAPVPPTASPTPTPAKAGMPESSAQDDQSAESRGTQGSDR